MNKDRVFRMREMKDKGMSLRAIAKEFGVSHVRVHQILMKFARLHRENSPSDRQNQDSPAL